MEIGVIAGLVVLIVVLLWGLLGKGRAEGGKPVDRARSADERGGWQEDGDYRSMADWKAPGGRTCPLCGHRLERGQTVKTRLITLESSSRFKTAVRESLCHIFGCPFCHPARVEQVRRCPVCKDQLGESDYVIGRYFEKDEGKNHLHVLGCTRCRER